MKRLITLAIMVAFILGGFGVAQAIEFKAKGDWQIGVMGVSNPGFDEDEDVDEFMATTRVRTTFEFIASENVKGVMRVHSGDRRWGAAGLGREDDTFEFDRAYLDFMVPDTAVNMRVGKQPVALPNTLGSHILDDQIWGVQGSSALTEEVGLTLGWGRAQDVHTSGDNKNDEVDYFYAIAPVTMDGFEVNPFLVYGMMGSSAVEGADYGDSDQSSSVFWAGVNFSVDMFDPIVVKGDFNYGTQGSDISGNDAGSEARGWIADVAVQYKMDMVTPEVFFLYESGESSSSGTDSTKRSKVMPSISGDLFGISTFGMSGSPLRGIGRATLNQYDGISAFGPSGKMAFGAKLGDITFYDNVSHDLQLTYYQGTNHKDLRDEGGEFFTTKDNVWEVTFDTHYQMYENLAAILELGYLHPSFDRDSERGIDEDSSFKAAAGFRYMF